MARPKAVIDWKRVDQMLMSQIDSTTIAESLGVSPDTLYRACDRDHKIGYAAYSQQKRSRGVATAREVFYRQCWIDNNDGQQATRQIFWLKNHADMSDKKDLKLSGEITSSVEVVRYELPDNHTDAGQRSPLPDVLELIDE